MGVCGLFFFIVGYALVRKDLQLDSKHSLSSFRLILGRRHLEASRTGRWCTHRTAALCSEVWQKRKRTSLRDLVKAYLADIVAVWCSEGVVEGYSGGFRSRLSRVLGSIGRWAWVEAGGDGLVWRFEALDR